MVFNATFNNISAILWWSVLLMEETGGPGENNNAMTAHQYHCRSENELIEPVDKLYNNFK